MALPQLRINLRNGGLGRVAQTDDGVAGMILTGTAVAGKMDLNKVYTLASTRDLTTLGITAENNPLIHKDVTEFYKMAGEGAELYLLVLAVATTLTQMASRADGSPVRKLIAAGKGRIRLVGLNRLPAEGYQPDTDTTGIDKDAVTAAESLHTLAQEYAEKINPFRVIVPALQWDSQSQKLYKPTESSLDRVMFTMAADAKIGTLYSAAVGRLLGRYAAIPVYQSAARPRDGYVALDGWLTNGKTVEENEAHLDMLHEAGYVIFRSFPRRNGYYFNADPMAVPATDDYSSMNYCRTIDKAVIVLYNAFLDQVNETIDVDEDGRIILPVCKAHEGILRNAVAVAMKDEYSQFDVYVDPNQNILSSGVYDLSASITPKGVTRNINISLGFENPALQQ